MRRKDDEKLKSIKEAVIKLILQEGFHGTSISKIAKMAGVSPATVYIYFENKDIMLRDIYREYSEEIFDYIVDQVNPDMEGRQLLEIIIRSYYKYIQEHREIFSFIEQFSNCPSLSCNCSETKSICGVYDLITKMKKNRIVKNYSNSSLLAVLFYPVKAIAFDNRRNEDERGELLGEMIIIIQDALLIR